MKTTRRQTRAQGLQTGGLSINKRQHRELIKVKQGDRKWPWEPNWLTKRTEWQWKTTRRQKTALGLQTIETVMNKRQCR